MAQLVEQGYISSVHFKPTADSCYYINIKLNLLPLQLCVLILIFLFVVTAEERREEGDQNPCQVQSVGKRSCLDASEIQTPAPLSELMKPVLKCSF